MLALAAFAVSGLFVSWSAYYAATEEIPAPGGSWAEGVVGQPTFVNPLIAQDNDPDRDAAELVFADLGALAEPIVPGTDGRVWNVTLKKGLKWSDGESMTADDVVFTVETLQDPDARSPQAGAWQGIIAEKTGEGEIRFTLKDPYAFFGNTLSLLKIAPKHVFGGIPAANLRLSKYNLEPVGSGPYAFAAIATEKDGFVREMAFAANPRYAGTPPLIPSFTLEFYRTEDAMLADFNAKKIDGMGGIDPMLAKKIAVGHRLMTLALPRYYAIFFNQSTHPALKEQAVRRALAGAIDRKALADKALGGYAAAAYGPIPQSAEGYDESAYAGTKLSRKEAEGALDAAGWLVNPEDGIRYKTAGGTRTALKFDVVTPDVPFLVSAMKAVADEWAAIGVRANPAVSSPEDIAKNALRTRNYQMLLYGNVLKGDPDAFAFWHSSRKFWPGLNLSLYGSKEADALLESVRKGAGTKAETDATLAKLQRIIAADAPAAFLFDPTYLYAVPANLKGFSDASPASPSARLKGVEKWYLKTRRAFKK